MSLIVVVFVALDLAGIYFNIRMLLSCFKKNRKHTFLQKYRPFLICQFVYQVLVLATNTIEAWSGDLVQRDDSCGYLKMLLIYVHIFLVSINLAALWIITAYHPIVFKNQELSATLLILAPVCVGIIGFALLWWKSCWLQERDVQEVPIAVFFVVVFLLLSVTWIKWTHLDQTSTKLKAALLWETVKEQRKACFVTTWLVICCVVVVVLGGLPWLSLEESDEKIFYLLMMNSFVGIALPVAFNSFFESLYEEENEMKTVI